MSKYDRMFSGGAQAVAKTSTFGGIVQSVDESELKTSPTCYTPKGVNFWIDNGNLRVRNNYEAVTPGDISLGDGRTYRIMSMFAHAPGDQGSTMLLAGCEATEPGGAKHYALLARNIDMAEGAWAEVKCALLHSFGSGLSFWFANANFTFASYTGDFYENGKDTFATILANGDDFPMFYTAGGLSVLKSDGWVSTAANGTTHKLQNDDNVAFGDIVQLFSRTRQLPGGLTAFTNYYAVNIDDGGYFQLAATPNPDAAIQFTGVGANLMARVVSATSAWVYTSVNLSSDTFTAEDFATNDDVVEFRSATGQMPKGLSAGTKYYVINANAAANTFQICGTKGGASATVSAASASTDTLTVMLEHGLTSTLYLNLATGSSDTLSVTNPSSPSKTINIALARTTASKNTAANIQAAIRNLGAVDGVSVSAARCVACGNWNTAAVATGESAPVKFTKVSAIGLSQACKNVYVRQVNIRHDDAPKGANIFVHSDRLWLTKDNTLYHNAGYYDNAAHPYDWIKDGYAGNIPLPTWDGDKINSAKTLNGKPWICKENSVWCIEGNHPPYTVRQIFTAKGTIAQHSIVWYEGYLFYAAEEGMLRFDGASTQPYLTQEIRNLWYTRNTSCICNAVGDTLFVYGQFYHPVTRALGWGQLMVDIPTKNICYQDMSMGGSALPMQCVLEPWFTTLQTGVVQPYHWFASGSQIYRYAPTTSTSNAQAMQYYFPSTDFGASADTKDITWLYMTGRGGACRITPVVDNVKQTTSFNAELPATLGVVEVPVSGVMGKAIGWVMENVGGDPVEVHDFEMHFSRLRM